MTVEEIVNKLIDKCFLRVEQKQESRKLSTLKKSKQDIIKKNLFNIVKFLEEFSSYAFIKQFLEAGVEKLDKFEVHLSSRKTTEGSERADLWDKPGSGGFYEKSDGGKKIVGLALFEDLSNDNIRVLAGTIIHEFTHLVLDELYENDCCPYKKGSKEQKEYEDIMERIKKVYKDTEAGEFHKVLHQYKKKEFNSEIIVRIPKLIVTETNPNESQITNEDLKCLIHKVPELLSFWMKLGEEVSKKILGHRHIVSYRSSSYSSKSESYYTSTCSENKSEDKCSLKLGSFSSSCGNDGKENEKSQTSSSSSSVPKPKA